MLPGYSSLQIRQAEAPVLASQPADTLMQQASAALALTASNWLHEAGSRISGAQILVLAGPGNNGGDALYAAARLSRRGAAVRAALFSADVHPRALKAAQAAGVVCAYFAIENRAELEKDSELAAWAAWGGLWIDGIFGIGLAGPLRPAWAELITQLEAWRQASPAEPIVIAADIPSGLHSDTGAIPGPFLRANATVAFGGAKPALLCPPAAHTGVGKLIVVDLELPLPPLPEVWQFTGADAADVLHIPQPEDHKYSRGVVSIYAGSAAYPGAGILTVGGAGGSGVGLVRYLGYGPEDLIIGTYPAAVLVPGRTDASVIGPGLDPRADLANWLGPSGQKHGTLLAQALAACLGGSGKPVVLDAGALVYLPTYLAGQALPANTVLTPHAGELAAVLTALGAADFPTPASVTAAPVKAANLAAELLGAVVLLKGAQTVVAGPAQIPLVLPLAPASLATAGSGDVLAGLLGGLLASAATKPAALTASELMRVSAAAAWLHASAATLAGPPWRPLLASEIARWLPTAVEKCLAATEVEE